MILDKIVSLGAPYASPKPYIDKKTNQKCDADIKDGDIVKILDEGTTVPDKFNQGKSKQSFKIETRNGVKIKDFNATTLNNLIDAYGKDTKQWVGKEIKMWIFKVPSTDPTKPGFKYNVYSAPIDWEMNEDGKFLNPEKADINIEGGKPTEEGEEMNWDDVGDESK
jgi:hypothetical protein